MRAVNLIPAEQRTGQPVGAGRSQGVAYAVLVLIAGLAVMAYAYGSADHDISSRQAQAASLAQQAQQVQQAAERLAPYTSFVSQREERTQAVETLMDSRFDWAHAFHEFGRVLPAGVSISSLSGTVGSATGGSTPVSTPASTPASGGAVASATPPGTVPTFSLSGCATSQPTVAETLQRLRLIDGVKEVTLQSSAGTGAKSRTAGAATTGPGGCPTGGPVFSVQILFDPLPSASAVAAVAKPVSDRSNASAANSPEGSAK
jgi:Tfp pilus assembly protein PilN